MTRSGLSATFTYDDASRVTRIDYGNDAYITRQYDDADRLEWIKHYDDADTLRMQVTYTWNLDNTVGTRTEYDNTGASATTAVLTFWYDNRQRLTRERRVVDGSTTVYDITYEYDELGNRMEKLDDVADIKTCYVYDTNWNPESGENGLWDSGLCFLDPEDDGPEYDTRNNRLLEYREYEDDGQGGWDELRRVRYVYYETGHVANITIKDVGDDWYRDLALFYTSDGKLWRVLWDEWKVSGEQITNYDTIKARELYYDGPRQRYLSREVDPDTWEPTNDPQLWTDYNGPSPYGDFELTFDQGDPVTDESMRYLAGSGIQAQQTLDGGQPDETSYLHGDLIGSTMLTTNEGGTAVSAVSYTAFGEPVGDLDTLGTRYQYAGGWGYESGLLTLGGANPALSPVTLQHVGWRWYQPDTGRFTQRDPIGIFGGVNVYVYVGINPLIWIDPRGLFTDAGLPGYGVPRDWKPGGLTGAPHPPPRPRDGLINESGKRPPRTFRPWWQFWRSNPGVGDKMQRMGVVGAGVGTTVTTWGWRTKRPRVAFAGGIIAGVGGCVVFIGEGVEDIEDWIWDE